MSVRKRTWTTSNGETRTAWFVDYRDGAGARRAKQFSRKKDADAFRDRASHEVREGIHVADRATVTVAEAASLWLESGKAAGLERTTLDQRRQHIEGHIVPLIGAMKLNKITVPTVRAFQDRLRSEGRSVAMIKRVTTSLGGILADAQERGLVTQNPVRSMHRSGVANRHKKRLEIGIDIPTPDEIRRFITALPGNRYRPLLLTAIFTGLRASELRGLRWRDLDLQNGVLHVRQRIDRYNENGDPKSAAGKRRVPLPTIVANMLREWKLAYPRPIGEGHNPEHLVFPTGKGKPENLGNIIRRGLWPACLAAGLTVPATDENGQPVLDDEGNEVAKPKYTGMHALRHFYASWCINRKQDGGLEMQPKSVQERLGHSSIVMTLDTYGHLFPSTDDGSELAKASAALFGNAT